MGTWLGKHGESIYGTRGGPFKPGRFGVSTHKGHTIYLHIQRWSGKTPMLPAIEADGPRNGRSYSTGSGHSGSWS